MKVLMKQFSPASDHSILLPSKHSPQQSLETGAGITQPVAGTGYGLDDKGVGVRVPVWSKFSLLYSASHPIGIEGFIRKIKRPKHKADHSPRTTAEVKKTSIYTSTPP
jgi:hypothetical protein